MDEIQNPKQGILDQTSGTNLLVDQTGESIDSPKSATIVRGSSTPTSFASAEKQAWLSVGNVNLAANESHIQDHLKSKFPGRKFSVEALPVREEAKSRTFKVGADFEILDELYKSENWPKNIKIRRYRFFRGKHGKPEDTNRR